MPRCEANISPISVLQSEREANSEPRDDLWKRSRHEDIKSRSEGRETHGARRTHMHTANIAHGIHREQRYGNNPMDRAKGDLGRDAKPEQQEDHWIERNLRDRVKRNQKWLSHFAGQAPGPGPSPTTSPPTSEMMRAAAKARPFS